MMFNSFIVLVISLVFCLLQFDFDSAAPPSQAWRRKLNSHASKLKEFSVTFREAIKMVCKSFLGF